MEKELDPVVIKTTQSALGKYVKRPPLTEKLLRKPPFRFLHDIVTCVLKTTGFFEGLFDEEELVSENVKDREHKIVFLNKVITVVSWTTGKPLSVKPSKIVAGQEAEKTNELLQCIALALDKKLTSNEAVKKFKEGTKTAKADEKKSKDSTRSVKKSTDTNKLTSKSNEKLTSQKKESNSRSTTKLENDKTSNKIKGKERIILKNESPPRKTSQQSKQNLSKRASLEKRHSENNDIDVKPEPTKLVVVADNESVARNEIPRILKDGELSNETLSNTDQNTTHIDLLSEREEPNLNSSYTIVDNGLNSSLSSQDLMDTENMKSQNQEENLNGENIISVNEEPQIISEDTAINTIIKPISYEDEKQNKTENSGNGNKANFIKENESHDNYPITKSPSKIKNVARPLSVRPSSSRPGAPRPRDKHENILVEAENIMVGKVNIIAENAPNEEEEDNSIIIVEQENPSEIAQDEQEQMQSSLNEHGRLVQQILDSQKEYSQMSGKTEIEWQFGAKKARDALNKEIEQLRFDIQALSRVANPLGKLLDHIQEDVEVMRQELHQWTKTYEETSKELSVQKALNEESLFPLYAKVKQLDADITEKHDKINDLKIIIHKNSLRVEKLLENGNVQ
ncbi:TRAF3-interacting protein 1 [Ostrinia furnacalis]|uniref:TRAF3-interacting protein 1 n=1 Tax=Ostrinia furnacalis TaxID=93504 RepID=UPI00103C8C64|nr:TRAF3-interacting protein 1 [Ostrinia furnacalis]